MALYDARQSVYVDGDNIDASDSNDEFDRLLTFVTEGIILLTDFANDFFFREMNSIL